MKAFIVDKYGNDVPLSRRICPPGSLGEHDVLIAVHAAGVNPIDREDQYRRVQADLALQSAVRARPRPRRRGHRRGFGRPALCPWRWRLREPGQGQHWRVRGAGRRQRGRGSEKASRPVDGRGRRAADGHPHGMAGADREGATCDRATGCSSTPAPVASARSPSSSPNTSAPTSRPPRAPTTSTGCTNSAPTRSSTTAQQDFATALHDYDLVLDSLGGKTLEESLRVVRPGGLVIGIGGPPDPDFAGQLGKPRCAR